MADFLLAYKDTAANEGGYVNDPNDSGGITYCGITKKWFPHWAGWAKLNTYMPLKKGQIIKDAEIENLVVQFYKENFWDKIKGDHINNQDSAANIYDFAVNAGVKRAVILAQNALEIEETGVMDDVTLHAINNKNI